MLISQSRDETSLSFFKKKKKIDDCWLTRLYDMIAIRCCRERKKNDHLFEKFPEWFVSVIDRYVV
jgi:hypothetical protein